MHPILRNEATDRSFFIPAHVLDSYEEFSSFDHHEKAHIIDFIQFAYNKESPFVKDYEQLPERLVACLKISMLPEDRAWSVYLVSVGVDPLGVGIMDPDLIKLCNSLDDMIGCFLRIQNSNDFEMYVTLQMLFWEYSERLRKKVPLTVDEDKALKAMDTKVKITEPCLDLISKIEGLREKIFGLNERAARRAEQKIKAKAKKPRADSLAA